MELSILAVVILAAVFINGAKGSYGKMIVAFLGVVLLSMVLLNWNQIKPFLIKGGSQ